MALFPEPARAALGRRETIMSRYIEMAHRVAPPDTVVLLPKTTIVVVPVVKSVALPVSTHLPPVLTQKAAAGLA